MYRKVQAESCWGIERKHRQIFTTEDAGGGRREVRRMKRRTFLILEADENEMLGKLQELENLTHKTQSKIRELQKMIKVKEETDSKESV